MATQSGWPEVVLHDTSLRLILLVESSILTALEIDQMECPSLKLSQRKQPGG